MGGQQRRGERGSGEEATGRGGRSGRRRRTLLAYDYVLARPFNLKISHRGLGAAQLDRTTLDRIDFATVLAALAATARLSLRP